MNPAITKTISLLALIGVGYLFQSKIASKDHREGIKTLILSLALPATIFIALLQIDFRSELIAIPILAIGFNIVMHFLMDLTPMDKLFNLPVNQYRTLIMLIPSLAPGLSCLPFIMEYSGQGPLAMAALADVGNKIFVLIISYTIAMRWYFQTHREQETQGNSKMKSMMLALINEPVNIVIVIAVAMLAFGMNYNFIPEFGRLSIDRLSMMMTPLILLFIGISIRFNWSQFKTIFAFLFFRSAVAFAISGMLLTFLEVADLATALLIVVFPQSACSFWPYSHMAAVTSLEQKSSFQGRTFDLEFAMNVLACSMPFSVILILLTYASGSFFGSAGNVFMIGGLFFIGAVTIVALSMRSVIDVFKGNSVELRSTADKKNAA
jgi:malate permease and related proteins